MHARCPRHQRVRGVGECQPSPRSAIVRHAHTDLTLGRVAPIADNDVKARLVWKGLRRRPRLPSYRQFIIFIDFRSNSLALFHLCTTSIFTAQGHIQSN